MRRFRLPIYLLAFSLAAATRAATEAPVRVESLLSADRLAPGATFRVAVVLDLAPPWHLNANPVSLPDLIPTTLALRAPEPVILGPIQYPAGAKTAVGWAEQPIALYTGRVTIFAEGRVRETAPPGPVKITGELQYQACNDQVCVAPITVPILLETRVAAASESPQPVHPEIFASAGPPPSAPGPAPTPAPDNSIAVRLTHYGLALTLISIFLAGLALNLTPCVFPMIAITVSYFGGQTERNLGRALARSVTYFFGIVITYSLVGLVAALTGALFGSLLQNPLVLLGIAVLLVVMAMSMFGWFELQPPRFLMQRAAGLSSKAGYLGLFLLGAVVGIIAAPCVAPIQVSLLAYVGRTGNPWLGWWMFFCLSAGLGLPYVILGAFPGLLARLPKSGLWMVWVKRVFGVVLLLVAAWFLHPLVSGPAAPASPIDWKPYSPGLVARAGKPVLIDFTASWCPPCHEMDQTTYLDPRVVEKARQFLMLKADLSSKSDATGKLIDQFHIAGVPTAVFLTAHGNELPAQRQTGYVPPKAFLRAMDQALAAGK